MSGSKNHSLQRHYPSHGTAKQGEAGGRGAKQPPLRSLRRGLRGLRESEDFRLWIRFVLPPEEAELLRQWALADEATYGLLVRRYGKCHDESDREDLLNRLQQSLACFAQVMPRPHWAKSGKGHRKVDEPS